MENYQNQQSYVNNPVHSEASSSSAPTFHPEFSDDLPERNFESLDTVRSVIREFLHGVETVEAIPMANSQRTPNIVNRASSNVERITTLQDQVLRSIVINLENTNTTPAGLNNEPLVGFTDTQPVASINSVPNSDAPSGNTGRNLIETRESLQFLLKYFPFCLILLSKAIYDHSEGIFNLIILCATFIHANSVVKREATAQVRRSLCKLSITLIYILTCFAFIAYVLEDEKLFLNLVFIPPYKQPSTAWDLLWATGLTDLILKLITILFKIVLTMLPGWLVPFPKRGKIYLFIEAISQLYRSLATIQPWLFYLLESYQGAEKIVSVFLSAAYMVTKGNDLMSQLKLFKTALLKLLQNVSLGSAPSKDQIQNAGNYCPICHDSYDSPVLLQCHHIFCESCVSIWFDREQTCPLCRAKIVDDPSWRDGSTTFFVQLF